MFIVVRHGTDERLLFNPLCRVANLLSDIKERCNFGQIEIGALDLCDETGNDVALCFCGDVAVVMMLW